MGEADSRNYQGRFLSDDYTMADLIRNSDAREASRLKESELRDQILIENEKKELKSHLDSWIEGNNNALSYMYLFRKDFRDSKRYFQKHGMHYEHSASELESIRLKEYLNNFITDEQRVQLREEYNKIMNAPKDDWQNQLLKNHMLTNAATMNQFRQQNEVELAAQVQEIHDYNKEVKDGDTFWNNFKEGFGKVTDAWGKVAGFGAEVGGEIPHFGQQVKDTSNAYQEIKEVHQEIGEKIRDSGSAGKWVFDAGDTIHEKGLELTIAKATGPLSIAVSPDEIHQLVTGTSIEDQSLMGTGEVIAGFAIPGADVALMAHEAVQLNEAQKEQEQAAKDQKSDIDQAIDQQYGSDDEAPQPMRLIREPQHSSKPKGLTNYAYKPPTVERDTVIKETAPPKPSTAPSLKPRETPKGYGQKPTSGGGGGTCKPKRKPIPACN